MASLEQERNKIIAIAIEETIKQIDLQISLLKQGLEMRVCCVELSCSNGKISVPEMNKLKKLLSKEALEHAGKLELSKHELIQEAYENTDLRSRWHIDY